MKTEPFGSVWISDAGGKKRALRSMFWLPTSDHKLIRPICTLRPLAQHVGEAAAHECLPRLSDLDKLLLHPFEPSHVSPTRLPGVYCPIFSLSHCGTSSYTCCRCGFSRLCSSLPSDLLALETWLSLSPDRKGRSWSEIWTSTNLGVGKVDQVRLHVIQLFLQTNVQNSLDALVGCK